MRALLDRILSDNPLIRSMSYQSVLSAFGEGAFLTGSAVYFTRIVGLSAAQVGLGMTIAGLVTFATSVPLGKAADRFGTHRSWAVGSVAEAVLFATWFLARDFGAYLAVTVALEVLDGWTMAGRNAYRLEVFPPEQRVRSLAYMRASRNVGYTLGALAGGLALAARSDDLIKAVPLATAGILLLNAFWISRLPAVKPAGHDAHARATGGPPAGGHSALRNRGFLLTSFFDGILGTHGVLLNTVIPLWLVEETDAPRVLLAWLFGTNTVMAVLLQVAAARGVSDVRSSLRAERRGAACFVASCIIVLVTHNTVGWLTIALVWLGHVTVTGSELFESAGLWGLQAELSDPRRRGEYQGAAGLGSTLGNVWAPAAYTWLAMSWGTPGWLVIAGIICVAAVGIGPSARAAERFLARLPSPEPATAPARLEPATEAAS